MTPKEAMEELIEQGVSKYRIAKVMDMGANMIDHYLTGAQETMRSEAANALKDKWSIEIDKDLQTPYQKKFFIDKHNRLSHD